MGHGSYVMGHGSQAVTHCLLCFIAPMIARRAADPSISHQPSVAKAMLAVNVKPAASPSSSNPGKKSVVVVSRVLVN